MSSFLTHHRRRILVTMAFLSLFMAGLCGQLGYLMIFRSEHYSAMADDLHERERTIKAARGEIVDRNGTVIASNRTVCTVSVVHNQVEEPEAVAALALDKSDFSLFKAGSSYQLKATVSGVDAPKVTWTSSDETVAAVSQDGTVTAVARGTATITAAVEGTELRASCTVRCKLPEDQPVSGGGNSSSQGSGNGGSSSQAPAADQADLSAFYTQLSGDYEFPSFMQQADQELMEIFYPGLSAVSSQQMLVYVNQMSMNMGELALIEVTDSKDVDGVKAILQARIDGMINGGAWYPEPTRIWTECSRVVSNGNYILMVVHEQCDAIVDDFNALF